MTKIPGRDYQPVRCDCLGVSRHNSLADISEGSSKVDNGKDQVTEDT